MTTTVPGAQTDPDGAAAPTGVGAQREHGDGPVGYPTWTLDSDGPVRHLGGAYSPAPHSDSETRGSSQGPAAPPTPQQVSEPQNAPGGRGAPAASPVEGLELAGYRVGMAAEVVDDLERTRIANTNRLAAFRRNLLQPNSVEPEPDPDRGDEDDGGRRSATIDLAHNHTGSGIEDELIAMATGLVELEAQAIKTLERAMKAHPLGAWVKAQRGLGHKQTGRLLAAIGDPYWNARDNHPRTVSALWRYTGFDVIQTPAPTGDEDPGGDPDQTGCAAHLAYVGVAPRRRRGERAAWSHAGHMRAILIANSCVKQLDRTCTKTDDQPWADHIEDCRCSPYRKVYDHGRRKYAGCDITDKHKHQRAVRLAAKEILKDLWIAARQLHTPEDPDPATHEASPQGPHAGPGSPAAGPGQDASATHDSYAGPSHTTHDTQVNLAGPGREVRATPKPPAGPGQGTSAPPNGPAGPGQPASVPHVSAAGPDR
jgi:hypothetical protein